MTVYTLMNKYQNNNPNGHFFDSDTLRFFGERLSEMNVLKKTEIITDVCGEKKECYVLSSLQHKHPLGARRVYHYFDINTFNHVIV